MQISLVFSFASLALVVMAKDARRELPDLAPLHIRQTSGPLYECHADCGYAILDATGNYCTNSSWLDDFHGCLKCADVYNIWPDYGSGVTAAAQKCGLSAVPSPASSTAAAAASTSNGQSQASSAPSSTPTVPATSPSATAETWASSVASAGATPAASTNLVPTIGTSTTPTASANSTTPTGVVQSAAGRSWTAVPIYLFAPLFMVLIA